MRYLKSYKIFESVGNELLDILLEINDENYWKADYWSESQTGKWVVIIKTEEEEESEELEGQTPPSVVVETIERLIDFMNSEGFTNYQITFEIDEYNEKDYHHQDEYEEISLEGVSDLDVWPNNFIRIEFWK